MELLLVSDMRADLEALDVVFSIPPDQVICIGDVVYYGPDLNGCIDRMRAFPCSAGSEVGVFRRVDPGSVGSAKGWWCWGKLCSSEYSVFLCGIL